MVKLQASSSLQFFPSFLLMFVDDKVKVLGGKFSYRLENTALDGMDILEISPVKACEMALKI